MINNRLGLRLTDSQELKKRSWLSHGESSQRQTSGTNKRIKIVSPWLGLQPEM